METKPEAAPSATTRGMFAPAAGHLVHALFGPALLPAVGIGATANALRSTSAPQPLISHQAFSDDSEEDDDEGGVNSDDEQALQDKHLYGNYKSNFPNTPLIPEILLRDGRRLHDCHGVRPLGSLSPKMLVEIDFGSILDLISGSDCMRKQGGYSTLEAVDLYNLCMQSPDLCKIVTESIKLISERLNVPEECVTLQFGKANAGASGGAHTLHTDAFNADHCRVSVQIFGIVEKEVGVFYLIKKDGSSEVGELRLYNGAMTVFVPMMGEHGLVDLPEKHVQLTLIFEINVHSLTGDGAIAPTYPAIMPYDKSAPSNVSASVVQNLLRAATAAQPSESSKRQKWRSYLARRLWRYLVRLESREQLSIAQKEKLDKWRSLLGRPRNEILWAIKPVPQAEKAPPLPPPFVTLTCNGRKSKVLQLSRWGNGENFNLTLSKVKGTSIPTPLVDYLRPMFRKGFEVKRDHAGKLVFVDEVDVLPRRTLQEKALPGLLKEHFVLREDTGVPDYPPLATARVPPEPVDTAHPAPVHAEKAKRGKPERTAADLAQHGMMPMSPTAEGADRDGMVDALSSDMGSASLGSASLSPKGTDEPKRPRAST